MSFRFTRFIAVAGAATLATLAACSENTTPLSPSNNAVADSNASDNALTDFFGMLSSTVSVSIDSSSVAVGHAAHAVATIRDSKGNVVTGKTVTWSSSDATKASVSSSGTVTGVAVGSASITATYSGKSGKGTITVKAASTAPASTDTVATISVTLASTTLAVGKTTQASYKTLSSTGKTVTGAALMWASGNTAIATVSSTGLVTAVAPGTAQIAAGSSTTKYGSAPITVTAAAGSTPSQPAAPVAPTQPSQPTGTGNLASANFEDGTYGSLYAETPGHLAIIADPTNSGHGKVMQVSFACGGSAPACIQPGTTRADLNQFASWNPTSGLSHGSTFYFKGQVYFPANTSHFNDGTLRKILYFRTSAGSQFDYVVNMFGTDVGLEVSGPSQTDTRWSTGFTMPLGQWVTVEVSITTNSQPGTKDGSTTIWINGNQVLSKTGIAFTAASDPATTRWNWMAIGHQREGVDGDSTPISEVRYWDNIAFGTSRIGN